MDPKLRQKICNARQACEEALQSDVFKRFAGIDRDCIWDALGRATAMRNPELRAVDKFADVTDPDRAHGLLLAASLRAIEQVAALPVSDSVKNLFADEFLFYAAPPPAWRERFRFGDQRFHEMGRIATLQRFPAGQYHWELAAFPRSWLPRVEQRWTALRDAIIPMRGFVPLFELHLNDRRKNRVILLESETRLSCYRAARSLELQPAIKGIQTISWLYCESTGKVSPHLAWMRRFFLEAGAAIVDLGDSPRDAGFLIGSTERRRLYEEGSFRPKESCVLWPRERVQRWAGRNADLDR